MKSLLRRNLRTRLTLLYASLLTAALLVYAGCVSAFFLHNLQEQLNASLDRDVETVEGILQMAPDGRVVLRSHEGEAAEKSDLDRGYLLEVWSHDGRLLYRTEELAGRGLELPSENVTLIKKEAAHSVRLPSGTRVRLVSRITHHLGGGEPVLVRLAVSEEPLWREFREMLTVLALGLPLVVALVVITGYLVAARALRPVDSMAQRAAAITAEHLSERLVIENPDDELGQLGTAFNATLARLHGSFDQLRRFTADASHELRTPLTAIRSVGEVSLRKQGNEKYYRDVIGSMLEETTRLTQLVDSLLTMSRADAGRIQLHSDETPLLDFARETASVLEVLAEEKEQTLSIEGDRSVSAVIDRTILRQALLNLIDNAIKYSPHGGSIVVRVQGNSPEAVLEVWDSGPGIPQEHRSLIFERFYRIDRARSRTEGGTGLGLSIAQWAVTAHLGSIEVRCEPGEGSVFRIRLPRTFQTMNTSKS